MYLVTRSTRSREIIGIVIYDEALERAFWLPVIPIMRAKD
jgi:hypothetical protein